MAALPKNIDPKRVTEITEMLSANSQGIGVTYHNRDFWQNLSEDSKLNTLMKEVPELTQQGMPKFVDSLYLDFSKSGIRITGEKMMTNRFDYLFKLVMAECYENKNNYTTAIDKAIISLCEQPAWTLPAHDTNLDTFYDKDISVDLVSATFANGLAQSIYLLDDKLSPEVKQIALNALDKKVFAPFTNRVKSGKLYSWMTWTLNWNSVCLAGIVGAATAVIPDKAERAFFIAVAEQYHTYGLDGYSDDGYCSEGVSYFSYGFGSLISLRETVCRATKGKIDFFDTHKFFNITQYLHKIQIINQVCPAYSDSGTKTKANGFILNYCSNALGLAPYSETITFPDWLNFSLRLIGFFPHQAWPLKPGKYIIEDNTFRSFFNISGIYTGRPGLNTECKIGVSAKGGNNAENHNHNDVGSYAVVVGTETMAGDQGGPLSYPADYFKAGAYDKYKIKGSYGHPVPFVNGIAQHDGKDAHGQVNQSNFTDIKDIFTIEISSAYADSTLKKLERSFVYDRTSSGSFTVKDTFEFSNAGQFETAVTTRAKWNQIAPEKYKLTTGSERVVVNIEASSPFEVTSSIINVNSPDYMRIGIRLLNKQNKGFVNLKYSID